MHPWKAAYQFFINIFKRKTAKIKQVSRLSSFNSVLIKPSREATDDLLKPGTLLIVKDGTFIDGHDSHVRVAVVRNK